MNNSDFRKLTQSVLGIPLLAPELILLYKSVKPEDTSAAMADFKNTLPGLSPRSRLVNRCVENILFGSHLAQRLVILMNAS